MKLKVAKEEDEEGVEGEGTWGRVESEYESDAEGGRRGS